MDNFLADYFGTNQTAPEPTQDSDELEKMAQLVMLDKIAANEDIDLSSLNDDEYVALAGQVFDGQPAPAEQAEATDLEKMAEAKFEEAKFLGQVVAHSMWNELDSIQKVAGKADEEAATTAQKLREAGERGRRAGERAGERLKELAGGAKGVAAKGLKGLKAHKGKAALIGGGLALAGGGAIGAKALADRSKEGSAMDSLSDARAYEILQEHGLADEQGNVVTPEQFQKQAGEPAAPANELASAVELEAWEKLAALGYPVTGQQ